MTNPAPKDIEVTLLKCLSDESMPSVYLKSSDALITVSGDDTYMTIYNPSEETIEPLGSLATSRDCLSGVLNNKEKNMKPKTETHKVVKFMVYDRRAKGSSAYSPKSHLCPHFVGHYVEGMKEWASHYCFNKKEVDIRG